MVKNLSAKRSGMFGVDDISLKKIECRLLTLGFFLYGMLTTSTDASESHAIYTPYRDLNVGTRLEVDVDYAGQI